MKRTYIILVLVVLAMVAIAYFTPKKIDWTATYAQGDKIPYGDYVLYERLKDIFPGSDIGKVETAFYNFGVDNQGSGSNYIIICDELKADDLDVDYMSSYVAQGNNVFIAAYALPQKLEDTLGIEMKNSIELLKRDSETYIANFAGETIKTKAGYRFRHEDFSIRIADADTNKDGSFANDTSLRHVAIRPRTVLGTDQKGEVNFVKIPFGDGAFYIHSFPLAFTNYNILKRDNNEYVAKCLSFLPNQQVYWDEYYKPLRKIKADTPLRFVMSVPAYAWALYTGAVAIILYMLFVSKRKQRIIPIIKAPVNLSLQFTRTIGSLYHQKRNHRDIAIKKMVYLLEKIRQQYFMQTAQTDGVFRHKLAQKSNVSIDTINKVFDIYENEVRRVYIIEEGTLIRFNTALEKFYSESGLINK